MDNENIQNLSIIIPKIKDLYKPMHNVELEYERVTIDGKDISINAQNYNKYILSSDRDVRKQAFDAFFNSLAKVNKSL